MSSANSEMTATPDQALPRTAPKRMAFLSGSALLLAMLQLGTIAFVYYSLWIVPRQQPPRNVEWGEGVGFLVFMAGFVIAHMILAVIGLVLTLLSRWRREQPTWLCLTALSIYGPATVAAITLVVWRLVVWLLPN